MLMLALLIQAATPPATAPADPRAKDVVDLFEKACVEHVGDPAFARGFATPGIGRPMTPDELLKVDSTGSSTAGYIVKSPHDGSAALYLAPAKRTCGVEVREAGPVGMKPYLETSFRTFYGAMGATVATARPDETITIDSITVHRSSWLVTLGAHQLAVIASFGDKPMGGHQHLMTFTFLH